VNAREAGIGAASMPPLPERDLAAVCRLTSGCWEQCQRARIFLTGGTGFFGIWLVESFIAANQAFKLDSSLTILTRDAASFLARAPHLKHEKSLDYMEGDVREFNFPSGKFEYIIHAATAASAQQAEQDPLEMFSVIVSGTERVLQFARQAQARSLLFTSSGAVYGPQPAAISHMPEDFTGGPDALNPSSVYAEGKRAAEQLCCLYLKQYGLQSKIARCFAFVGPHLSLDTHFAIGNFIADAMRGRDIQIRGDGTPRRSYLYASDLAAWLWNILFRGEPCRAYNVGSEDSVSILRLAEEVVSTLRPESKICVRQQPDPAKPVQQYVPSTARARKELGLAQTISLKDAISWTAAWHGFESNT
jgi:nucleoside-diphosphate-sugar epimerase